jgi:hypothetical protein
MVTASGLEVLVKTIWAEKVLCSFNNLGYAEGSGDVQVRVGSQHSVFDLVPEGLVQSFPEVSVVVPGGDPFFPIWFSN